LERIHEDKCKGYNQKLCNVQEYPTVDSYAPYDVDDLKGFMFRYKFTLPKSSRGHRESKPFKIVSTEEFVWTELGLLGTIGGTLGLMIGFSFSSTTNVIIDSFFKVWGIGPRLKQLPNQFITAYHLDQLEILVKNPKSLLDLNWDSIVTHLRVELSKRNLKKNQLRKESDSKSLLPSWMMIRMKNWTYLHPLCYPLKNLKTSGDLDPMSNRITRLE